MKPKAGLQGNLCVYQCTDDLLGHWLVIPVFISSTFSPHRSPPEPNTHWAHVPFICLIIVLLKDSRPALKSEAAFRLQTCLESKLQDFSRAHKFWVHIMMDNFGGYFTFASDWPPSYWCFSTFANKCQSSYWWLITILLNRSIYVRTTQQSVEMSVDVAICRLSKALAVFCCWTYERRDDIALSWVITEMENGKLQSYCRPGLLLILQVSLQQALTPLGTFIPCAQVIQGWELMARCRTRTYSWLENLVYWLGLHLWGCGLEVSL